VSGQRVALIIANDTYEQGALQNLRAPAADAEALARVLGDPQIGNFAVQVVRNEPAHIIQAHIEEVSRKAGLTTCCCCISPVTD
jgi:hypothetical protein